MKKLSIILAMLLLFTGREAKQRECSGCKWCVVRTQTKTNKKRHVKDDCSNCHWCVKKNKRLEKKKNRLTKKEQAKKDEPEPQKEEIDPNVLAQDLIQAIKKNQPLERMETLIDQGANLDYEDRQGRTPLHWAALYAQPYTVGLLLIHQADIEAQDYRGNTPLHLVVKFRPYPSKRKKIIEHFLFEGASIYDRNDMGFNVLENSVDMDIRQFTLLTSLKTSFVPGQISF